MVALDGRPELLPPCPPGCAWMPLKAYCAAVGEKYSTVHERAQTGQMTGESADRPLAHQRGQFWWVAGPVVKPERRRVPAPDLPDAAALSLDPEALGRDLGAAFAGVLGRHLRGAA